MATEKVFKVNFYNFIKNKKIKVTYVDPPGVFIEIPYTPPPNPPPVSVPFKTEKDFIIFHVSPPNDGDIEDAHYLAFWKSKKSMVNLTKEKKHWVLTIHIDHAIPQRDPHTTNVEVGTKQ